MQNCFSFLSTGFSVLFILSTVAVLKTCAGIFLIFHREFGDNFCGKFADYVCVKSGYSSVKVSVTDEKLLIGWLNELRRNKTRIVSILYVNGAVKEPGVN